MAHDVIFHPAAKADLFSLYDYIDAQSGAARAADFVDKIETAVTRLEEMALRGTPRDDIAPGIRTPALRRRVPIVFRPSGTDVEILRVLYAGRDFGSAAIPD